MDGIELAITTEGWKLHQLWKCKNCKTLKLQEKQTPEDTEMQRCLCIARGRLRAHEKVEIELLET